MKDFFAEISSALPLIARFAGGFATVICLFDNRRKTVDSRGREAPDYPVESCNGFSFAVEGATPLLVPSEADGRRKNLFLVIGNCMVILSEGGQEEQEERLKSVFKEAIPLIARIAGGEAVLFDREGVRFHSVGPDGGESDKGVGQFTYLGKRSMELMRPVIGPSLLEDGALAVRIPITDQFGMGVNNVVSVRQKKHLAASRQFRRARYTFADVVGESAGIRRCIDQARQVAGTNSTVLIFGETGTGKELFVQSIHQDSQQSGGPFVAINCGAMPAGLIESELFGYEAGSFTGARKQGQQGLFEQANGGTLFLDEVSEMEMELQSRLLRVIQEREVVRIGGNRVIPVEVRVIASTNRDLWRLVQVGKFRQDLFYRLNVVELRIPPLRQRLKDIPVLARHFIERFRFTFGSFVRDISEDALRILMAYPWPGNVRELQNCIERIMNLSTHEVIQGEDIPVVIREGGLLRDQSEGKAGSSTGVRYPFSPAGGEEKPECGPRSPNLETVQPSNGRSLKGSTRATERTVIVRALEGSGYNRSLAASRLGISTTTLWRKMKRLGIQVGS